MTIDAMVSAERMMIWMPRQGVMVWRRDAKGMQNPHEFRLRTMSRLTTTISQRRGDQLETAKRGVVGAGIVHPLA